MTTRRDPFKGHKSKCKDGHPEQAMKIMDGKQRKGERCPRCRTTPHFDEPFVEIAFYDTYEQEETTVFETPECCHNNECELEETHAHIRVGTTQ